MADTKRTKAEVEAEIRDIGISRVNTEGMTRIGSGTFYLEDEASGRYIEYKVVVKSEKFDRNTLDGMLDERAIIEANKAERASIAEAKRAKDEAKRAKAKASVVATEVE